MTGKQAVRRLEKKGWVIRRIKGSHHIMAKGRRYITVPVHGNKELGKKIQHAIAKEAEWL